MKFVLLVILSSILVSCADHLGNYVEAPVTYEARAQDLGKVKQRKVVKTGRMELVVENAKSAALSVESIVSENQGRIDGMSQGDDVHMKIRVPVESLASTMSEFAQLGSVKYQNVSAVDVTEKYIDVDAKLKNLKVLRSRLHKLYAKGDKVEELIKVEKEMARVQGEIDSLEGRMRSMQNNIKFSKITLNLEQKSVPGPLGVVGKSIGWFCKKLWVLN